eukprot:scaffold62254_cov34-Attheya_sp.AAC.2
MKKERKVTEVKYIPVHTNYEISKKMMGIDDGTGVGLMIQSGITSMDACRYWERRTVPHT